MARLKITAFVNTDDLDPKYVDLSHSTGLSNEGFMHFNGADGTSGPHLGGMEDVDTELVDD